MLSEMSCPLVLAVPNQNHRLTHSHNDEQIILCSLVGSHKFKPKSQYNCLLYGITLRTDSNSYFVQNIQSQYKFCFNAFTAALLKSCNAIFLTRLCSASAPN